MEAIKSEEKNPSTILKRDESVDVAKGIGIFLVVWAHTNAPFGHEIFLFHMPLFFLLSGLFFASSVKLFFKQFLKKKSNALLRPIIFFACIFLPYWFCFHFNELYKIKGTFFFDGTLWFLWVLFGVMVICYLVERYIHRFWIKDLICVAITVIGVFSIPISFPSNIFFLRQMLISYIFFYLGFRLRNKLKWMQKYYWMVIYCLFFIIGIYNNVSTNMAGLTINPNYLLFFLPAIGGIGIVLIISKWLCRFSFTKKIAFAGKNSLMIMCIHLPLCDLIHLFLVPCFAYVYGLLGKSRLSFDQITGSRSYGIVLTPIAFFISLYLGVYLKRKFPNWLGGKKKVVS